MSSAQIPGFLKNWSHIFKLMKKQFNETHKSYGWSIHKVTSLSESVQIKNTMTVINEVEEQKKT